MQALFDTIRPTLGPLSQSQVDGIELIVKSTRHLPLKHSAYILATAWHETAKTMQPIAEFGKGKGKKYGVPDTVTGQIYYGRGHVQLTWKENYAKAQKRLKELDLIGKHVDFVNNPDLVLKPNISVQILVAGMVEGWFTGKKLSDYDNYIEMRKIVNGRDKDTLIATYAEVFEDGLIAVQNQPAPMPKPIEPVVLPPSAPPKGVEKSIAAWIIGAILVAFAAFGAWMTQGGN